MRAKPSTKKNLTAFNKSKSEGAKKLDEAQNELASSKRKLEDARRNSRRKSPTPLKDRKAKRSLRTAKKLADLKSRMDSLDLQSNIGFAVTGGCRPHRGYPDCLPSHILSGRRLVSLTTMTRMVEDDRTVSVCSRLWVTAALTSQCAILYIRVWRQPSESLSEYWRGSGFPACNLRCVRHFV